MENKSEISTKALIAGDNLAVKRFAREASLWIYATIYSIVLNKEDTEELVQDVIFTALDNISNFENKSSLKTWVFRIAVNKSKDFLKFKSRKKRKGSVISIHAHNVNITSSIDPYAVMENKEKMSHLMGCINKLPENQKMALILSKIDAKTLNEIADILNISYKAVESLLGRAKKNLLRIIEENKEK